VDEEPGQSSQSKRNKAMHGPIQVHQLRKPCVTVSASYYETSQAPEQHTNPGTRGKRTEALSSYLNATSSFPSGSCLSRSTHSSCDSNAYSLTRFSRVTIVDESIFCGNTVHERVRKNAAVVLVQCHNLNSHCYQSHAPCKRSQHPLSS
jgi:hypothetical protein